LQWGKGATNHMHSDSCFTYSTVDTALHPQDLYHNQPDTLFSMSMFYPWQSDLMQLSCSDRLLYHKLYLTPSRIYRPWRRAGFQGHFKFNTWTVRLFKRESWGLCNHWKGFMAGLAVRERSRRVIGRHNLIIFLPAEAVIYVASGNAASLQGMRSHFLSSSIPRRNQVPLLCKKGDWHMPLRSMWSASATQWYYVTLRWKVSLTKQNKCWSLKKKMLRSLSYVNNQPLNF